MNKDVRVYLHHIMDAIAHIHEFLKDMDHDDFNENYLVQSAVIRQFEIIGEAAAKALAIDSQIPQKIPAVPWRKMVDMRNKLIHDYMGVQVDLVWDTIHKHLNNVDQAVQHFLEKENNMKLIEWEVAEDSYQEQIHIPQEQADQATEEGISTENKAQVAVRILNMKTGEYYGGRLKITGNRQLYLPVEVQKLLEGSGTIRIQILGG